MQRFTAEEMMAAAAEARQPVEVLVKCWASYEARSRLEQDDRRASPEERAAVISYLKGLAAEGRLQPDTAIEDILKEAGVTRKQGTASIVAFNRKKMLAA